MKLDELGTANPERYWEHAGVACEVVYMGHVHNEKGQIIRSGGHRCGYVRIPTAHPWTNILDRRDVPVEVHGRWVTYLGPRNGKPGIWIGFHTQHVGDDPKEWTEQRAAAECESLANQIKAALDA